MKNLLQTWCGMITVLNPPFTDGDVVDLPRRRNSEDNMLQNEFQAEAAQAEFHTLEELRQRLTELQPPVPVERKSHGQ